MGNICAPHMGERAETRARPRRRQDCGEWARARGEAPNAWRAVRHPFFIAEPKDCEEETPLETKNAERVYLVFREKDTSPSFFKKNLHTGHLLFPWGNCCEVCTCEIFTDGCSFGAKLFERRSQISEKRSVTRPLDARHPESRLRPRAAAPTACTRDDAPHGPRQNAAAGCDADA